MNYWAVQVDRTRKLSVPVCVFGIDGNFIPQNAFAGAAARLRLTCVRLNLAPQLFREQMVLIPVLLNSRVRQARQDSGTRTGIVRWQNRFPHRKDTDARILILL